MPVSDLGKRKGLKKTLIVRIIAMPLNYEHFMISLIIATWNGAATLARTCTALSHLQVPEGGLEIIVVDNASTDETAQIIARFQDQLPLVHLTEPKRGKAHALNTGIEAARGTLLVFSDDDVLPDPGWLCAFETAAKAHPEYGFFIGQVRHDWACPPPRWLEQLAAAGLSFAGTPSHRPAGPVHCLAAKGPNMAVRRQTLGPVRFRTEPGINYLGPGTGTGGEDTLFARDATGDGSVWYVPEACIKHMVRVDEIGVAPVFRRYVRIGKTNYYVEPDTASLFSRRYLGLPFPITGRLFHAATGCLYRLMWGDREAAARRMLSFAMDFGRLQSWLGAADRR